MFVIYHLRSEQNLLIKELHKKFTSEAEKNVCHLLQSILGERFFFPHGNSPLKLSKHSEGVYEGFSPGLPAALTSGETDWSSVPFSQKRSSLRSRGLALSLLVVLLTVQPSVGSFGSAAGQGQVMSAFGVGYLKG